MTFTVRSCTKILYYPFGTEKNMLLLLLFVVVVFGDPQSPDHIPLPARGRKKFMDGSEVMSEDLDIPSVGDTSERRHLTQAWKENKKVKEKEERTIARGES